MPDPATLRIRYPAFASVGDEVITYWLTDAALTVDDTWQPYQDNALMSLAAFNIARTGALTGQAAPLPEGVTSFKSASFSATVSDAVVAQQSAGGYAINVYGREFAGYLRRHSGTPRLVGYIAPEYPCGYGW
jgi:hypothetical protein